jgi:diguanylate cyclase (GGDEF)-like protein
MGRQPAPPDGFGDTVTLGAAGASLAPELEAQATAELLALGAGAPSSLPAPPPAAIDPVQVLAGLQEQPLTLVLVDIDGFEVLVERHGEAAGEGLMAELLERAQAVMRRSDRVLRWSRHEVLVLADGNGSGDRLGHRLAEALRAAIAANDFGPIGKVTTSIGVTESQGNEGGAAVFARLGQLLALTRDQGPNRVVVDHRERRATP